jgi:hypothetical protein
MRFTFWNWIIAISIEKTASTRERGWAREVERLYQKRVSMGKASNSIKVDRIVCSRIILEKHLGAPADGFGISRAKLFVERAFADNGYGPIK